ncbi:MAG: phosphoglucomutase (alpha-D-glucose-1,6-bisphosphate-dependent) [Deinococcales bacterium]
MAHPLAGLPAPLSLLENIPRLVAAYYAYAPDPNNPTQRVAFGTSGHRGSSLRQTFNDAHIAAVSQAVAEYRVQAGIGGHLYIGADSHALSEAALQTALEVLVANGVKVRFDAARSYTPTPLVSHAILCANKSNQHQSDGIVITPSHNPPEDGGFKYNPPHGGPAESSVTKWIESRANALLEAGNASVKRLPLTEASRQAESFDFVTPYVEDLPNVINIEAIRGVKIGVDPLGGSSLAVWQKIKERYALDLTIVNERIDPTFGFMRVDKDGKIRMDCSSPSAMAGLIELKNSFTVAIGNDPDADRHGIVTPSGLMNPNHYLAVCIDYLYTHRPEWEGKGVGKTLVSSSLIDRVVARLGRNLEEVPVGFKYFVDGLSTGRIGFGGEESAGASFQRFNGSAWSTDKDGILLGLLAAEIAGVTGQTPDQHYQRLEQELGKSFYKRIDAPASSAQKKVLSSLTPEMVTAQTLAGETISAKLTRASANNEPIGGLKVCTENAWFTARPSGTEELYKIYAESFVSEAHVDTVLEEAKKIVSSAFGAQ